MNAITFYSLVFLLIKLFFLKEKFGYDASTKRLKSVGPKIVFWRPSISPQLVIFSRELYRIVVFLAQRRRLIKGVVEKQLTFGFMAS